MKKSLVKQFEEQFGKEWVCTCSAPFEPKSLEIISENKNSLIAHYVCPSCQREQMLAAAIRHNGAENKVETKNPRLHLPHSTITADDVLDIKEELKKLKTNSIRGLDRSLRFSRQNKTDLEVSLGPDPVS